MDLVAATTLVYSAIGAAGVVADLTRLAIGAEMQTAVRFARDRSGFERLGHYEPVFFFVSLPARSRWRSSTRLRIRVEAEEISASRRQIRIVTISPPIELKANSADTTK